MSLNTNNAFSRKTSSPLQGGLLFPKIFLTALCLLPLSAMAESACPNTFEGYLAKVQKDVVFQLTHTRYPLVYFYVDGNADPEPITRKQKLTREQVLKDTRIRYPSAEIEKKRPLQRRVIQETPTRYKVRFDKPDSDMYSIEFKFQQHQHCWQLIEVNDLSL